MAIDNGSSVKNSVIRGDVRIGRKREIVTSFIGPYTSIGEGVRIYNSVVEHSVILDETVIRDIERLEDSLIGRSAQVLRGNHRHKALRLMVGDDSTIEV